MPRLPLALTLAAALAVLAGCGGDETNAADIAFVSSRDGDYAIFTMSAGGKGERRLTDSESSEPTTPGQLFFQVEPAWSPDGSEIAFASRRSGTDHIFVMDADGSGTRQLTSGKQNDSHPTWSPDGASIAFARAGDVFVMRADGSRPNRVSDIYAEESDPAWSPDGEWIAYVRRTPGTPIQNLWVMRADGSERHALTRQTGNVLTPSWSPDSTRIVFSMNREEELFELFTIGVDGKHLRHVAPTAHDTFEPSWSPDGSTIAYQEEGAIYTIELGGDGTPERLTDPANNDSSPVWNPKPPSGDE